MDAIFDTTRWVHILVGFTGLVAFWIPAFSRKGGTTHVRTGRVFEWAAYIVAGTAVFNALGRFGVAIARGASLAGNEAQFGFVIFLAYLGIVTFAAVRHAVRAVRTKGDWGAMDTPAHRSLAVLSMIGSAVVVAYALAVWSGVSIVLLALSPVGILQGREMLSRLRDPPGERMGWYYVHMGNIIGAGIAFHTAFLVFGSARFIPFELPGLWQIVPWILPAAIGVPLGRVLETRYRRRFGEPRGGRKTAEGRAAASA